MAEITINEGLAWLKTGDFDVRLEELAVGDYFVDGHRFIDAASRCNAEDCVRRLSA
jgi:hypothetical protein